MTTALRMVMSASAKQVQSRRWVDVETFVDSLVLMGNGEQQATPSSQVRPVRVEGYSGSAAFFKIRRSGTRAWFINALRVWRCRCRCVW